LKGAEYVIHSAGLVKMWVRDARKFKRVNVRGLQALLEEARWAGVKRIVYTSSFIAAGPSEDPNASEGLRNRGPYGNEYEESKALALDWLRTEGFARYPVVALLPGVIYGPGPATDGNLVGGMIEQYLAGKFPGLLGSGKQQWSFAFNKEVARAHVAAIEAGRPGEEYFLAGDNRSLNELFATVSELTGVQHKVGHLPFAVGTAVGLLEVIGARYFGHKPDLTPGAVRIFKHNWVYSSDKAVRELGYRVVPLEEGLRRTLEARRG
jgi:NAD+-dependent farnesol dehydrogenase